MLEKLQEMFEGGEAENPQQEDAKTELLATFVEGQDHEITFESIHNLGERVKQC